MIRKATAQWLGGGKDGKGTLSTQSGVMKNTLYSYNSRFADGLGTNPEELLAAALAGCFSMKLSFSIGAAGFTPTSIDTNVSITLDNGAIIKAQIETTANVPGMSAEQFATVATDAKDNCPVSKLFNTEKTLDAKLVS
jgi:lipoyl-dependent peroxiredoxin